MGRFTGAGRTRARARAEMELVYVNIASAERNWTYLSESLINTIAPDISISPSILQMGSTYTEKTLSSVCFSVYSGKILEMKIKLGYKLLSLLFVHK